METIKADFGNWHIQCIPEDGARISVLKYAGHNLLTTYPSVLRAPQKFIGEYETRPVYGYDDCFPSVDPCFYPEEQFECRDHGELCWQKWHVENMSNKIICTVECPSPKATFTRILEFEDNRLKWKFKVVSQSASELVFLHVMHALMPLSEIQYIELPEFLVILDEDTLIELNFRHPDEVADYLINCVEGTFKMLLLKNPRKGIVKVDFKNGLSIKIEYGIDLFPTLGIWWNNFGYPLEDGLGRVECAFEPIPGSCSNLNKSFKDGIYLKVKPGETLNWQIGWELQMK